MTITELRLERLRLFVRAQYIAARLGVSASTVSRWENGALVPTPHHLAEYERIILHTSRQARNAFGTGKTREGTKRKT